MALLLLSNTVTEWDHMVSSQYELHSSSYLLYIISQPEEKVKWEHNIHQLSSILPNRKDILILDEAKHERLLGLLRSTLERMLHKLELFSGCDEASLWAAHYLERTIRHNTGLGLSEEEHALFNKNLTALKDTSIRLLQYNSLPGVEESRQFLSDGYSLINLRQENAQLLGFSSFADAVMADRMATEQDLRNLHNDVAASFLPVVEGIQHNPFDLRILRQRCLETHIRRVPFWL